MAQVKPHSAIGLYHAMYVIPVLSLVLAAVRCDRLPRHVGSLVDRQGSFCVRN
jgi:hypothetical protein